MQLDEVAGRLVLNELKANGLEVLVGVSAEAFEGNGAVKEARLSDGTTLPCRMVVVGKGVLPAVGFIPRDKIEVDLGIVVNDHLESSAPGVYAAGDAAQALDVVRQEKWVNAIWPVAVEQGRIAGANMAGRRVSYRGSMGRNVMRIFGLDVLSGGVVNPAGDNQYTTLSGLGPLRGTYRKLVLDGDTLIGLAMVGGVEQGGVILSLIQNRIPISVDPELLLEPSFNFATLLR
jgi:NAD(P)H-nitrite reductase large subunit